jgi:hypothetical protein
MESLENNKTSILIACGELERHNQEYASVDANRKVKIIQLRNSLWLDVKEWARVGLWEAIL